MTDVWENEGGAVQLELDLHFRPKRKPRLHVLKRSPLSLVHEFHQVFGCAIDQRTDEVLALRARLIDEEFGEIFEEITGPTGDFLDVYDIRPIEEVDLVKLAKELADLVYVVYGTAVSLGIDLDAAVRQVHDSNMSKLGPDGKPILREDGKILKGPHYLEPDVSSSVKEI